MAATNDDFNAARRLYEILTLARAQDANKPAREVWALAFGVPPTDRAAIFRGLAHLIDLVDEVTYSIRAIPNLDYELYLAHLPAIRKGIGLMQLDGNWEPELRVLTEAAIQSLLFSSDRLRQTQPERKLTPDTLAELAKDVDALFQVVLESDIDEELRRILLACLESFRRAVVEYRIRGAGGLRDAALKTIAELSVARDKSWVPRFSKLLMKVNDLVAKAMGNYKALTDVITRLAIRAGSDSDDAI